MYDVSVLGLAAALFGLIAGSFLNALSFRMGTGVSVLKGRSRCMHCGHTLAAHDLVPVLSYLFLQGKCRYCGTKISIQYPLVELAAGVLSFGVFLQSGTPLFFAFWFLVWMTVLFIVVYDLRHLIIPWSCSLTLIVLSLCSLFLHGTPSTEALLAGPVLALPLLLLSLLSGGAWMGWGDWLFELSLGWLLGLTPGFTALLLGIWSGAIAGIALVAYSQIARGASRRGFTMKSELPFAPFLALGAATVFFLHVDLFSNLFYLF